MVQCLRPLHPRFMTMHCSTGLTLSDGTRGTGLSTPRSTASTITTFFREIDITPETDEERRALVAVAQEFADRCVGTNEGVTEHAGTNNSARDMDVLRRALGEETISYFGFSYGSELGATWATLFPDTVRAAVLDGAADPNADSLESSLQQLEGFEASHHIPAALRVMPRRVP